MMATANGARDGPAGRRRGYGEDSGAGDGQDLPADTDGRDGGGLCGAGLRGHYGGEGAVPHRRLHEPGGHGGAAGRISGWGQPGAPLAGSIGPALADVLLGSPIYAPATLVIKAGMAALAAACHQAFGKGRGPLGLAACGIVGELPMVVGYWLYDALLLGSAAGAAAGIPSQSGAGCLRHRRLHTAGGGSGPQRLRPAGVPPAVIPATWKKAPPAGLWPAGGALRLRENLKDACGGGPLARRPDPGRRPDGAEPPARPAGRGLLKERPPAGSKTRRGLVGLMGRSEASPAAVKAAGILGGRALSHAGSVLGGVKIAKLRALVDR